jgi:hypothetical protein
MESKVFYYLYLLILSLSVLGSGIFIVLKFNDPKYFIYTLVAVVIIAVFSNMRPYGHKEDF